MAQRSSFRALHLDGHWLTWMEYWDDDEPDAAKQLGRGKFDGSGIPDGKLELVALLAERVAGTEHEAAAARVIGVFCAP